LKQEVNKLSVLKLDVCSKINACYIFIFVPDMLKLELLTFTR